MKLKLIPKYSPYSINGFLPFSINDIKKLSKTNTNRIESRDMVMGRYDLFKLYFGTFIVISLLDVHLYFKSDTRL